MQLLLLSLIKTAARAFAVPLAAGQDVRLFRPLKFCLCMQAHQYRAVQLRKQAAGQGAPGSPCQHAACPVLPGHPTWKGATLEVMKTSSRLSPASRMPAATSASFCAAPPLVKCMHPDKGHCTGCTWEDTASAVPDRVTLCRSLLSLHGGLLERLSSRRRRLQGTFPAQGCNDARTGLAAKCYHIWQVTAARVATHSSVMRTLASWRRCSGPLY